MVTNHTTTTWLSLGSISDWITFPFYIYKVFKPLPAPWMDMLMYPYCIPTREVGWLANSWQLMGTNHTTTAWLRLGSTSDWSTFPLYKVFNPFLVQWMGIWMYPYCIPTREVGWLANSGQLIGTKHTITTWLRPGSTSDWITFPFYIYI